MLRSRISYLALTASAAAAFLVGASADAQSLKSIRAQEAEEASLAGEVAFTNSVCEANISSSIEWRTAANWPDGSSLADACDGALSAIEAICRSSGGKERAGSISSFVCAGDSGGPSLSGGTLRYGASPGGNGYSDTKAYLDGAL